MFIFIHSLFCIISLNLAITTCFKFQIAPFPFSYWKYKLISPLPITKNEVSQRIGKKKKAHKLLMSQVQKICPWCTSFLQSDNLKLKWNQTNNPKAGSSGRAHSLLSGGLCLRYGSDFLLFTCKKAVKICNFKIHLVLASN